MSLCGAQCAGAGARCIKNKDHIAKGESHRDDDGSTWGLSREERGAPPHPLVQAMKRGISARDAMANLQELIASSRMVHDLQQMSDREVGAVLDDIMGNLPLVTAEANVLIHLAHRLYRANNGPLSDAEVQAIGESQERDPQA